MNNIAITLIRLLSILIISLFFLYFNFILETLLKILTINKPLLIIPLLLYFIFPIYISIFLFLQPEKTAKILRIKDFSNNITYKIADILGISIILLGFYFCISSFVSLFAEIIMLLVKSYMINDVYLDNAAIAYMAGSLVKLIIGIIFILKGIEIAKSIVKQ